MRDLKHLICSDLRVILNHIVWFNFDIFLTLENNLLAKVQTDKTAIIGFQNNIIFMIGLKFLKFTHSCYNNLVIYDHLLSYYFQIPKCMTIALISPHMN